MGRNQNNNSTTNNTYNLSNNALNTSSTRNSIRNNHYKGGTSSSNHTAYKNSNPNNLDTSVNTTNPNVFSGNYTQHPLPANVIKNISQQSELLEAPPTASSPIREKKHNNVINATGGVSKPTTQQAG